MTQPNTTEQSYKEFHDVAIRDLLQEFECQPILFIGSGVSRRYFGAPNWLELLEEVFNKIEDKNISFEYLVQKCDGKPEKIGSELVNMVFEWAWKSGKENFPKDLFEGGVPKDAFLKYLSCKIIEEKTPKLSDINAKLSKEIAALQGIRPHAVITTNYDLLLEKLFDGYEAISGQTILKYNTNSFGEIFHIHGDVGSPRSIVLTENDYNDWEVKKKYISAKLLTYFAEHPVFIFGYAVGDANVKSILKDIGEILEIDDGLIPNIYQVIWDPERDGKGRPDVAIFQHDSKEFRTKAIYTSDFKWVFDALKSKAALSSVNPKLIRALAARTFKLIRDDIPTGSVTVNYEILEKVAENNETLPNLLGISIANNPNQSHPFTITQLAKKIGVKNWMQVNKYVNAIKEATGKDLRSTDNIYHCQIKTGDKSKSRKWSHAAIELFEAIKNGQPYDLQI